MAGRATRVGTAVAIAAAVVVVILLFVGPALVGPLVASRVRREAGARGLDGTWRTLHVSMPANVTLRDLTLRRRGDGDTVLVAESLVVRIAPGSLLRLAPRLSGIGLAGAELRVGGRAAEDDTVFADPPRRGPDPARLQRVRRSAAAFARLVTASTRTLPRLEFTDVTVRAGRGADQLWDGVRIAWLQHSVGPKANRLTLTGTLLGEQPVPFEAWFERAADRGGGRRRPELPVRGLARFAIPEPDGGVANLKVALDGALVVDRKARALILRDTSRVQIGGLPLRVGGRVSEIGPRFSLALAADGLTDELVHQSMPAAVLGPLKGLAVRGAWDYRLALDLDLARPDSATFRADVIPRGLALDPAESSLRLTELHGPFVARIRLPRDRVVLRDLSYQNPHYRSLIEISPDLSFAVVTNEDGAFFRHRGFNTEAVREAIGENVRSASFRRGAGTITMQLARNLYLGHARTLSRKAQEVVLAWVLEHLTGLPKERLLEIYLNIIEWGPGVHGADEAAHFYFGRDAGDLTLSQSLFLATLVPSPARWRQRLDAAGNLRPGVRGQMHFIGRAMVAKGWLAPGALPPASELHVEITGPARDVLFPGREPGSPEDRDENRPPLLRRLWTRITGRG